MTRMTAAIECMWEKSQAELTKDELKRLANLALEADCQASNLVQFLEGTGCLISEDGMHPAGAGSFQTSRSATDLLFSIAHQVDTIRAMFWVSGMADEKLRG